jgi:hypothetical protein
MINYLKKPDRIKDINDALEDVAVHDPDELQAAWSGENPCPHPVGYYGVSTGDAGGVVAYFNSETEACSYRLKIIDRWMNG